ncbi:MAG: hypothetical protein SH820_04945 [Xanthomonadales bacterium]|nr:hypothetical protein [Xanthomonadales bacterium]
MTFHKQNQGWLIGLGVMITLLWTSQFAADWFKPHNEIEFAQHSKIELANVIGSERSGINRVSRLESKPDPIALISEFSAHTLSRRGLWRIPFALAGGHSSQPTGLPGIRAPPRYLPSA